MKKLNDRLKFGTRASIGLIFSKLNESSLETGKRNELLKNSINLI